MLKYFDLNNRASKAWSPARRLIFEEAFGKAAKVVADRTILEAEKKEKKKGEGFRLDRRTVWAESAPRPARKKKKESAVLPPSRVPPTRLSPIRQIFMYIGIFLGVLLSTALSQFEKVGYFSMTINVGTLIISALLALFLIPYVYEKLSLNPAAPFIVQFGIFVQNGVFWHVIVNSIGKIV